MVSSYVIHTSITAAGIDAAVIAAFNELTDGYGHDDKAVPEDATVPCCLDSAYVSIDGVAALEYFKEHQAGTTMKASEAFGRSNWCLNDKGYLYDCLEKFHRAVSQLHHFIDVFFEPRGLKLNGAVIGVNTEGPQVYAYHVKDNVITLDEAVTRKGLARYTALQELHDDDERLDMEYVALHMCIAMGIDGTPCIRDMLMNSMLAHSYRTSARAAAAAGAASRR